MAWSTFMFRLILGIGILAFIAQLTELRVANTRFDLAAYTLAQSALFGITVTAIGLTFLFARKMHRLKRVLFRLTTRVRRLNPRMLVKIAWASGFLTLALFVARLAGVTP